MRKIIAFTGSNSSRSINRQLLRFISKKLHYCQIDEMDLADLHIPLYNVDIESGQGIPLAVEQIHREFGFADGFLIASPEHNGLPTAYLKNLKDWLSRVDQNIFRNKPVLLVSTSPGKNGGRTGLEILFQLLPRWGAGSVSLYSLGSFNETFNIKDQKNNRA